GPTFDYGGKPGQPAITIPNPFVIRELGFLRPLGTAFIIGLLITGLVTQAFRYRAAIFQERLQIRWLLGSVILLVGLTFIGSGLASSFPALGFLSTDVVPLLATFLYPIGVSIAILRYRLYDIDIIIRRTLVYSILTGILGAIYFGGVVLAQQFLRSVTGQSS